MKNLKILLERKKFQEILAHLVHYQELSVGNIISYLIEIAEEDIQHISDDSLFNATTQLNNFLKSQRLHTYSDPKIQYHFIKDYKDPKKWKAVTKGFSAFENIVL